MKNGEVAGFEALEGMAFFAEIPSCFTVVLVQKADRQANKTGRD